MDTTNKRPIGRPKEFDGPRFQLRMTAAERQSLAAIAAARGITQSDAIRELVRLASPVSQG